MNQNRDAKTFLALIGAGMLLFILVVFAICMGATTNNSRDNLHALATSEAAVVTKNAIISATSTIDAVELANSKAAATHAINSESTAIAQAATAEHQAIAAATREQEAYQAWEQLLAQSLMANSRALMADIDVTNQELTQARLLAVEANRLSQELGSPQEQAASQTLLYTLATEKPDANYPLATLTDHFDRVMSVAWNIDGSRLASASTDNNVIIWDTGSWQPIIKLPHKDSVYSVAWSSDGNLLAIGVANSSIIIWDTESWEPITTLNDHEENVLSLAWNTDSSRLASASGENYPSGDNMIIIWDTESWEPVTKLTEHSNEVGSIAWNAESTRLASGSLDGTTIIWQADENQPQSWQPLTTLNTYSDVWNVAWNEDGSQLASASHDGTIIIWQTDETQPNSWQPLTTVTAPNGKMKSLAWNKDGDRLAASTCGKFDDYHCVQGEIIVWDTESWLPITTLSEHKSEINSVAWSEDGSRLASASGDDLLDDNTVVIWNTESWEPFITLDDSGHAYRLAWSENGSYLATTKGENGVFIWQSDIDQPDNWQFLTSLTDHSDNVTSVAWNRKGNIFTSASIDGQIFNWDTENWVPLSQLNEHTTRVNSLAWNEDDSQLASAAIDGQIIIWRQDENNPNNWIPVITLTEHAQSVWHVSWTKDGSRLASSSDDGTVIIWDTESWKPLTTLEHAPRVVDVAWNEDGSQIASGSSDGTIIIWQMDEHQPNSWQSIATLDEHTERVEGLAWKADGSRLASASDDGTVIIWDTEIWFPVATLTEHNDSDTVSDVAWDNYNDRLASTSYGSGSDIVWNFPDFSALHCAMAGRNLTLAEWKTYFPGVDYRCTCEEWPTGDGAPINAPGCSQG